ncbi:MAG: MFS transporter [Chloroflexota bacterium]|nr:MFS transporter [Chloroflexota bacterium]
MDTSLKGLAVLRVLRHPALFRLWLAQVIYLSVQFTASYAMIVLITNETHSAIMVGLVIIALSLPLVLFGAPAGALVDRMDRRAVLWISNAVRAVATALFVVALLLFPHQFLFIYVLAFFFSLVGLFFSPAEGAIIPTLVSEDELLPALSLYNLTLNLSQAVGLLLLGPLALTLLPTFVVPVGGQHIAFAPVESLFIGVTVLYLIATALTASLPRTPVAARAGKQRAEVAVTGADAMVEARANADQEEDDDQIALVAESVPLGKVEKPTGEVEDPVGNWQRMIVDLTDGWRLVRRDGVLLDALFQSCFGGLIMLTIAELATIFVQKLLNLPTSDTALIFAPAGVGLLVGSLLVPAAVARIGSTRTMVAGMLGTAVGLGLIPIAQMFANTIHWAGTIPFLLVIAVLTAMVGFSLDFVIVPAQTLMQKHSPNEMRGRVLALYQALFNGGAIPVMLFMGGFADLLGIVPVIFFISVASIAAAIATILRALSRRPRPPTYNAPDDGPSQTSQDHASKDVQARVP